MPSHHLRRIINWLDDDTRLIRSSRPLTFISNHDQARIASQIPDGRNRIHAAATLMTIGGVPSICDSDERSRETHKGDGRDDDAPVRPAYPESPDGLDDEHGWAVVSSYQHLIGLRRRCSWLFDARTTNLIVEPAWMVYETCHEADRLIVLRIFQADPVSFAYDGLGQIQLGTAGMREDGWVRVPGYAWAVLS